MAESIRHRIEASGAGSVQERLKYWVRRRRVEPWLWIAPSMLVIAFVFVYPVIEIFHFSFLDLHSFPGTWVGLENYRIVFADERFWGAMLHNVELLATIPIMVALALVIAVLIFERVRGWRFYRSLVLVPYVVPIVAIGIAFSFVFQNRGGMNQLLDAVGLGLLKRDWLGSPDWALFTVGFVIIWREVGFGVILFLARLGSVSEDIFDAACIDGAGWWTKMRHIIIPELATVIEFFVMINVIAMVSQVFNYIYVMTNGGPGFSTWVSELYIYRMAFMNNQLGQSSVVAVILFLATILLIGLSSRFRRRLVDDYE